MLFKKKPRGPTPAPDDLPALTEFLAGYGFDLRLTYEVGHGEHSGKWHIYSSAQCDVGLGIAEHPFWSGDTYLIADSGSLVPNNPSAGVLLSNFLPNFHSRVQASRDSGAPVAEAIIGGFGSELGSALQLFVRVRSEGRWLPLRRERVEAGLEV